MFPVKESVNINTNRSRNFDPDFPMYCEMSEVDRSMVPRASVEFNQSLPPITSSSHNPGPKVLVENLYNMCEPFYNFTNSGATYSVNNRSQYFCSPEEFYTLYPDNQYYFNENCERIVSYKAKQPRHTLKITLKKKRKRTMFTTEQIIALEEVFNKKPYISREERMFMMKKLEISEKSIKVWFQNRRRLTDKKNKDYTLDSPSSEDMSDTISDRLTLIESNINQSTDEYGYVRLDNETMSELVNVIDDYLSQNPNSHVENIHPVNSENKIIYEPISPVSVSEDFEEVEQKATFETESSLQLADIEAMLLF